MLKYELLLILPGTLDDTQVSDRSEEIAKIVKEVGSDVELHTMGKNRLAYPIKQIRYGYFSTITFSAEAKDVRILEEKLRLHREVLRFLISHFNTNLTAQQKIAYTTDASGITRMVEKAEEAVPVAEKKAEKINIEEINKKLDDLMGGDVASGV
jgi:small subunit ribosomal protein S6